MLNKVLLIGRLTRDPEIRFLPSGSQVTSFSIAVNRSYKSGDEWKEETYFFDIETFGTLAERLGRQLSRGFQVLIEGELRQDRWENQNGEKRSKVKVIANKSSILSKPGEKSNKEYKESGFTKESNVEEVEKELPNVDIEEIDETDVPF